MGIALKSSELVGQEISMHTCGARAWERAYWKRNGSCFFFSRRDVGIA